MKEYQLIGYQKIISKKNNKEYVKLHFIYDEDFTDGKSCSNFFTTYDPNVVLNLDSYYYLFFDQFGHLQGYQML